MKLLLFIVLVVIGAIIVGKARENPKRADVTTSTFTSGSLRDWEFLNDEDWQRVMRATGGKKIADKLPGLFQKEAVKKQTQDDLDQIKKNVTEICEWAKCFSVEFSLGNVANPEVLKSAKIPRYLIRAHDKDGNRNVGAWIRDLRHQRKDYCPEEILNQAESLNEFCDNLGNLDKSPECPTGILRDIWHALDRFSKSNCDGCQNFIKLISDKLKESTAPPEDYQTLTVKDAGRLEKIQSILGSKEFCSVVYGEPLGEVQSEWKMIMLRNENGRTLTEKGSNDDPRKLLFHVLDGSLGLPEPTTK